MLHTSLNSGDENATEAKPKLNFSGFKRATEKSKSHGSMSHNDRVDSILLRLNSIRSEQPDQRLVVGITSANRKAGVSTIAGKLAVRAAELALGRILLIDANFQSPSQAQNFGIRSKEGLADILSRDIDIPDLLHNGEVNGLQVLTAGSDRYLRHVAVMPDMISALMSEMRSEFDLVLFDMPPVKNSARCLSIASECDGILVVADAAQTRAREVKSAVLTIESCGAKVYGTVLNRVSRTLPRWLDRLM